MLAPERENSRVHCVISLEKDLEDSKNFLISSIGANFTQYSGKLSLFLMSDVDINKNLLFPS